MYQGAYRFRGEDFRYDAGTDIFKSALERFLLCVVGTALRRGTTGMTTGAAHLVSRVRLLRFSKQPSAPGSLTRERQTLLRR